jgi:hypothetical protein
MHISECECAGEPRAHFISSGRHAVTVSHWQAAWGSRFGCPEVSWALGAWLEGTMLPASSRVGGAALLLPVGKIESGQPTGPAFRVSHAAGSGRHWQKPPNLKPPADARRLRRRAPPCQMGTGQRPRRAGLPGPDLGPAAGPGCPAGSAHCAQPGESAGTRAGPTRGQRKGRHMRGVRVYHRPSPDARGPRRSHGTMSAGAVYAASKRPAVTPRGVRREFRPGMGTHPGTQRAAAGPRAAGPGSRRRLGGLKAGRRSRPPGGAGPWGPPASRLHGSLHRPWQWHRNLNHDGLRYPSAFV